MPIMQRVCRVRRAAKGTNTPPLGVNMDALLERAEAIAKLQDEIECTRAKADELRAALFNDMRKHNLTTLERGALSAAIVTPPGRSSTYIHPLVLKKQLQNDENWVSCLTVSITQARNFLSVKEIERIGQVTDAVPGAPVLKVLRKKSKV